MWSMPKVCLSVLLLWTVISRTESSENENIKCDMEFSIGYDTGNYILSMPGQTDGSYKPGSSFTWCFSSPPDGTLALACDIDIPKSPDCEINALVVSSTEDEKLLYCGNKTFHASSSCSDMTVTIHSSMRSRPGTVSCHVVAEKQDTYSLRAITYNNCDCGYSYRARIVGGQETGINEYPSIAGLVDNRRGAIIVCGATIISRNFVLTADHCLDALELPQTAVVVGEHNITTGSETSATMLIRAKRFIPYPYYNDQRRQYDIALIEVATPITFTLRVGPACLPFASRNYDLTGQVVTVLGWGTTEFGGPRSKVLRKVNLDLVDISNCQNAYGSDIEPYTQLCAYRANKDACQYDSGGPLLFFNPNINSYEIVGLVSYGRGCASPTPSVNTRVAPFIQWILDNTPSETYCSKSN